MAFRDLSALFDDDGLEYKVPSREHPGGKTYRVASPDARTGLYFAHMFQMSTAAAAGAQLSEEDAARLQLDDNDEKDFYVKILGATHAEMVSDGVTWANLKKVALDAYLVWASSEEVANAVLEAGKAAARVSRAELPGKKPASTRAGSKSSQASGATRGRTRAQASTPRSRSTRTAPSQRQAG